MPLALLFWLAQYPGVLSDAALPTDTSKVPLPTFPASFHQIGDAWEEMLLWVGLLRHNVFAAQESLVPLKLREHYTGALECPALDRRMLPAPRHLLAQRRHFLPGGNP